VLEHPQTAISGEVRLLHQDGSQRICEITATNLLDDPAVGGIVLNAHDITKRRQAEEELRATRERFRSMVEVVPVGFWMLTPDWGQMLYVSPGAAKISGRSSEDLCRQPDLWRSNIHADDRQRMGAFWDEHHGQSYEVKYRIVRPDGDIRWVREVTAPIRDDNGELTLLTGIVEDITEHQRAEAQLLQATKLASLGVLAGGIAHELRNPLAIISVNTELLTDSCDDPRLLRQCARRISAAIQRASQVIENLLSFANPKNGRVEQVDLGSTFETALVLLHDHLALQRVRLRRDIPSDLPPVQGNPQLLQLVFTNMVLCACNAMPLGGLLVVTMRPDDKDGVVISFRDNGHGMTPEQLRDVFDPFVTFEPVGKGTGMGLAVSHGIIQQLQGSIEVQSKLGKGTTFTIRLPGTPAPA
jgi:PAS domain S-box-containing protein